MSEHSPAAPLRDAEAPQTVCSQRCLRSLRCRVSSPLFRGPSCPEFSARSFMLATVIALAPFALQAQATTTCKDGTTSTATGKGACSGHGGVNGREVRHKGEHEGRKADAKARRRPKQGRRQSRKAGTRPTPRREGGRKADNKSGEDPVEPPRRRLRRTRMQTAPPRSARTAPTRMRRPGAVPAHARRRRRMAQELTGRPRDRLTVITIAFDAGVLLPAATWSCGTSTLASGKYAAAHPRGTS